MSASVDRTRSWGLSRPALLVCAVLVVFVVTTFAVRLQAARDDETAALEQRADQLVVLLEASIAPIGTNLRVLAALADGGTVEPTVFRTAAKPLVEQGGEAGIVDQASDVVAVSEGAGLHRAGAPARSELTSVLDDAREEKALATEIVPIDQRRFLVLAQPSSNGAVAYLGVALPDPVQEQVDASSGRGPFGGLIGAVYTSPGPDQKQLLVSTLREGETQETVDRTIRVGGEDWFAVIGGTDALTGDFQQQLPWMILVIGLVVVMLATGLVESLARRKNFAEIEVANRTRDLEETMAALDNARSTSDDANRSKSQFLSRMSHELRTPLNAVLGFTQVLELDDLDDRQRLATGQILKGGRHLLDLINEILDLSRIEAGELSLSPEPVLVADLLDDAVDLVRPLAAEADLNLTFSGGASCHRYVLADRQRTKQIILNLLSNAIKYNRPRGTVAIFCEERPDRTVRVSVADTGFGVPAEKLALVFEPFERLDAEGRGIEGSGIGLALSRQLALAMGATLGVDSTLGEGSTFWLDLPPAEGPIERYERLDGSVARRQTAVTKPKILHIEDNLANLRLMEHVLEHHDADLEIVAAMQGRLGLELAREHRPEIILLDLHLPDVAGDVVLEHLRSDPTTASIPVVMVSADASPNQVRRLLAAGAAAYLTKPIDVAELLSTLDRLRPRPTD